MCHKAHCSILNSARHPAFHRQHTNATDYQQASDCAIRAADELHAVTNTATHLVWVQVVRYLVEFHAHTMITSAAGKLR